MNIFISGSMAYDRIMDFPGYFKDYILPEKIHVLNVCFNVNGLQEKFGGTAGNVAYSLALLDEKPVIMAAIGKDYATYFEWLKKNAISTEGIEVVPEEFTGGAYIFEVASENVECVQFSVPGESLEYFVIYGPTPKDVLTRYAALTGFPALPPAWSFGLWLSTSFTTNYDEPTVTGLIEDMIRRDLPLHVFHFDCFWMKAFRWCDFQWDARTFPDPAGMLKRLKDRGLHICVWINPYIAQCTTLFDEAVENGYLLKRKDGRVWQTDLWQAGMGIVDFTNPKACQWFGEKLRVLAKMGMDSFQTDFGERIPTDVVYHDGSDGGDRGGDGGRERRSRLWASG